MTNQNRRIPSLRHYQFSEDCPVLFHHHSHGLIPEPIHDMHVAPELGVVLSGRMRRFSSGVQTELPRGGVWMAGVLEPHGRQAIVDGSSVAVFIFRPDFLFRASNLGGNLQALQAPFCTPAAERPTLIDEQFACLAERLIAVKTADSDAERTTAQISLTLLDIILHVSRLGNYRSVRPATLEALQRLQPAFELADDARQRVHTTEAAARCGLSVSRFTQLFTQATGQSFRQYSLRYRLSRVAGELKTSSVLLDELAQRWGFANKSHLVRRFREHYGVTPAVYRGR
jgi:AraC-like DNA-binding protein